MYIFILILIYMKLIVISIILVLAVLLSFASCINKYTNENFDNPIQSSADDVSEGASEYYGWGYNPIDPEQKKRRKRCPKCDKLYINEHVCNVIIDESKNGCGSCDITKHPDIDKYVLKSSVPPCPDMSQYATKTMLQPQINLDDYVPKSELSSICSTYSPDNDQYILKTQCVPQVETKYVRIEDHPDYKKILKKHCEAYKGSWFSNFEEWWDSLFNKSPKLAVNADGYPLGYGWSPHSGYGTDNQGYALDGGIVSNKSVVTNAGLAE